MENLGFYFSQLEKSSLEVRKSGFSWSKKVINNPKEILLDSASILKQTIDTLDPFERPYTDLITTLYDMQHRNG